VTQSVAVARPPARAVPDRTHFPPDFLDACRVASLKLAGPNLTQLGVTSAIKGEGRSTISLGMAIVQREDYDRRVILIDLDLETPSLAGRLGLAPWPGVCEVIGGEASVEEVLQPLASGIQVMTSGAPGGSASRIISEAQRSGFLAKLAPIADVVIVDLPPLLGCAFGMAAAGICNDLLLVVRARVTPLRSVREAVSGLSVEPTVLLNGTCSVLPEWLAGFMNVAE
jgi:Mrp family chromosome partitioning ATPase